MSYSLDTPQHCLGWTAAQEMTISRDYPFANLQSETPDQYVVRNYLQFLWLPDSIMPVKLLVPALLRVNAASSSSPHPLHALLDPLLLTPRAAANKYHVELPQILSDGGGAGEIEENMMWYTLNYEKRDEPDDQTRLGGERQWNNEAWRKPWLERLERREVQVQILLHLLILSLPQAQAPIPDANQFPPSPPSKHKRNEPKVPTTSLENHLESFMDKLSMWQLVERLESDRSRNNEHTNRTSDDRDWMQIFCQDTVEPCFKSELPELCALLRTKVFPSSPFSEDESSSSTPSRPASPYMDEQQAQSPPGTSDPSPALPSVSIRHRSTSSSLKPKKIPVQNADMPKTTSMSRSRSLSVTLALDADARKAGTVGTGVAKKRVLNREVSMSRGFKGKGPEKDRSERAGESKRGKETTTHFVENAGLNRGKTLVAATPVKAKAKSRAFRESKSASAQRGEEEDMWNMPGSPEVLVLGQGEISDEADTL